MTRIVVSDTSCMIDLRKADLLEAVFRLPYRFVMPDTLFASEWSRLTDGERQRLVELGLEVRSLPGPLVERASTHFGEHPRLTLNDCFALTLAEEIGDCVLLTGDGYLRRIGERARLEVRGVLWIIDELEMHGATSVAVLRAALKLFHEDDLVFLPPEEVLRRLRRLTRLL